MLVKSVKKYTYNVTSLRISYTHQYYPPHIITCIYIQVSPNFVVFKENLSHPTSIDTCTPYCCTIHCSMLHPAEAQP